MSPWLANALEMLKNHHFCSGRLLGTRLVKKSKVWIELPRNGGKGGRGVGPQDPSKPSPCVAPVFTWDSRLSQICVGSLVKKCKTRGPWIMVWAAVIGCYHDVFAYCLHDLPDCLGNQVDVSLLSTNRSHQELVPWEGLRNAVKFPGNKTCARRVDSASSLTQEKHEQHPLNYKNLSLKKKQAGIGKCFIPFLRSTERFSRIRWGPPC